MLFELIVYPLYACHWLVRAKMLSSTFFSSLSLMAPLAFMRGRTFKTAYIIADEMQNATPNQCKMLMTRIGQGSKIVITGDVEQADRNRDNNGLMDLCQRLEEGGVKGIAVCHLDNRDIQRHAIIDSVLRLYTD
jgi:phosphate starvation-inducible PhoH-like protein